MKNYFRLLLSFFFVLNSCGPKLTERKFPQANTPFKPKLEDSNLNLRLREFGEAPPELKWQDSIPTEEYLKQAENIIYLGQAIQRPDLVQKGLHLLEKFYRSPGMAPTLDFATGPYLQMATAYSEYEIQDSLNDVLLQMEEARHIIISHILNLKPEKSLRSERNLQGLLVKIEHFNELVLSEIPKMNLPEIIESGFKEEFIKTTRPLFQDARNYLRDLARVRSLSQVLTLLESAINKFKINLTAELKQSLQQGHALAKGLDEIKDAQGALTVLVDIWNILTPQERLTKIKPANEELYNFLEKQNPKELKCLRTQGCLGGPIDGMIKRVFLFPKLRKYGVEKIKNDLNQETLEYVVTLLESLTEEFLVNLPLTFAENIEEAWLNKVSKLVKVRNDVRSYVTQTTSRWAKRTLSETEGLIPGFEVDALKISLTQKTKLHLQSSNKEKNVLAGSLVGQSLSAAQVFLEEHRSNDQLSLRTALSLMNKLVAITGYRDTQDQLIPAFLHPLRPQQELLDIAQFEKVKNPQVSFRISDKSRLLDPFHPARIDRSEQNYSAQALAAQIAGISKVLKFTADWKESNFNSLLSPILAQDLTQDAQTPSLQRSLFPKEMLFALSVGGASVLLLELTKENSPIFMITTEDKRLWLDQYTNESQETAVMAGAVDFKENKRASRAQTIDSAQLLLALADFLKAIEGIENTQSPILVDPNEKGHRPLETLIEAKKDLKLLIIALANFLSFKMKNSDSLIMANYDLTTGSPIKENAPSIEIQAYAIRALTRAYEISGIEAYLWSAKDIYYSLNRSFFTPKLEFYSHSDGSALNFPEKINCLHALSKLLPHLSLESQQQLRKIMTPWLDAIMALK